MGVLFGDTRTERFSQGTGRLDLRRLEGPLPTASLVQRTEQLVYYHELQTQQKEAQLDRMLGHTGSATRPGPGGARRAGASPGTDAGRRSTDALARARWQVARHRSSQAGRPRTWWTACCGWQRQRTGPPAGVSSWYAASRAAWSRRDAYQRVTCPSVPALLQRPVRPSEEMAAPSCSDGVMRSPGAAIARDRPACLQTAEAQ